MNHRVLFGSPCIGGIICVCALRLAGPSIASASIVGWNRNPTVDDTDTGVFQTMSFAGTGDEDCNSNGAADTWDVANSTSEDCDTNDVPDECEPDCNTNQASDACDIASGDSLDVDRNGVPDECEPVSGMFGARENGAPRDFTSNLQPLEPILLPNWGDYGDGAFGGGAGGGGLDLPGLAHLSPPGGLLRGFEPDPDETLTSPSDPPVPDDVGIADGPSPPDWTAPPEVSPPPAIDPPPPVPEPGTALLLTLATAFSARRRRLDRAARAI